MKGKIPNSYRRRKKLRKWRNGLFDVAQAVEAPEWSNRVTFQGADAESTTVFSQCPICAALVIEDNRDYHYAWHIGGSV